MSSTPKVVDLFSGAGGFSCGFEMAGFESVGGFDIDESAVETYNENHSGVGIVADLTEYTGNRICDETDTKKDEIIGVVGGPPCQGFSTANGNRNAEDERNQLVFHYARLVSELDAEFFVMENVPGILSIADGTVPDQIVSQFSEYGYDCVYRKINTAQYGVPQKRERVIFVGVKTTADVSPAEMFPEPTHMSDEYVTVTQAFDGLPRLEAGEETENIPNHRAPNHHDSTVERISKADYGEKVPYDSWSQKTRLHPNEASPTILAGKRSNYHRAHPEDDRGLTVRERARLQTFPDTFVFKGSVTDQRRQTGNAVPPLFAHQLAEVLKKNLV